MSGGVRGGAGDPLSLLNSPERMERMPHLELKNLVKSFGGARAVDNLNLSIEEGEFVSLLGASGCGKTTTLRMVAGFTKPTQGRIFLAGKDITDVPARERKMGMVFQSYALFPTLTVYENICFGLRVRGIKNDAIAGRVQRLLELGHMEGLGRRYPSALSGGQQPRVALLRALAIEPSVLLLDEPLSNLDAKMRVDIRKEIRKMQLLLKITAIYVTHDQEEALAVSDQIAVMDQGKIQQCGTPLDVYLRPASKFVSDFIGRSNFLKCELAQGGGVRVEERLHRLDIPERLQGKTRLMLSFRPQHVHVHSATFSPQAGFSGLVLPARFVFETFLGTMFQVEALTAQGEVVVAEVPIEERNALKLERDQPIVLTVSSDDVRPFEA